MATPTLSIVLFLVINIFLRHSVCLASPYDCVHKPRPPLNGHVSFVSGMIQARLTCANPKQDLTINARGKKSGILICDPMANEKPYDFENVEKPACLPYKKPKQIRMLTVSSFTINGECPEEDSSKYIRIRSSILSELKKLIGPDCAPGLFECSWSIPDFICDVNYNYDNDGQNSVPEKTSQLDMETYMMVSYSSSIPIQNYTGAFRRLMERASERVSTTLKILKVENIKFLGFHMNDPEADCAPHKNTAGTKVFQDFRIGCRGCKKNRYFDPDDSSCRNCPKFEHTKGPFASRCVPCNDRNSYPGTKEEYEIDCLHTND